MAPAADLRLSVGEHVVYFYDDDRDLTGTTVPYLCAALDTGGAAIAIATAAHRAAFAAGLAAEGVDVEAAQQAGTLLLLDAEATLGQFFVDGTPGVERFQHSVGVVVSKLAESHRPVHAFGEMVGLLWDVGDVDAVIELERLWNDLLGQVPFSLLCAYPATALDGDTADSIHAVCDAHSGTVSALPAPPRADALHTFPGVAQSPGRARHFLAETLDAWGGAPNGSYDDAALIVTEFAVNAIKHAKSGFTLSLDRHDDGLRITVGDADPRPPVRRTADPNATTGRGLILVDAVAAEWGWAPHPGGKLVWAEIGSGSEGTR
jgi:anti-sigma regulatory factor (Ser/Thr protein kinase)